jgi:hypothetical protein
MFGSQVASYNDDDLIGTDRTTAQESFDPGHPLYRTIGDLTALTRAHPALRDGAQQHRWSSAGPGVYAFSRIDARQQVEYVVALNNSEAVQGVRVPTYSARASFKLLYGAGARRARTGRDRALALTVPPLSAVVYRASEPVPRSRSAPAVSIQLPATVRDRFELTADVAGDSFYEVAFSIRVGNERSWTPVGIDDNAPYRVYPDVTGVAPGTPVRVRAIVRDNAGHESAAAASTTVG